MRKLDSIQWAAAILVATTFSAVAQDGAWTSFGNGDANSKYSALSQINAENFESLEIAWRWESISKAVGDANARVQPGQFKATPLMIDGILYVSTALCQVAAIDASTGETVWSYDPKSYEAGRPANIGWQHRGVTYWADGNDKRIVIATHDKKLIAINANTGEPVSSFGDNGMVDLMPSLGRKANPRHITHSSPVAICNDTIIVGSIVHDGPTRKEAPPGHVRGFDVRTGKFKWRFHTIPIEGEFGNDTWENGSWKYSGAANVWSMMAVDEDLGYVYLPTGTSTNDMYGGHRLGDNLFAESLICLNADTGKRVWHFQMIHHGVWDYDLPTAPNIMDIVVDGKAIKAIAQVSKQGFTYVFDRVTGKPVWPIEERPVMQSEVPGERTSPTQPFPTKPAAFDRQGITPDDLNDLTPAIREEALTIASKFTLGPLFSPPVTEDVSMGRIILPGTGGGANWPGAAYDPDTNTLFIPSNTSPGVFPLTKPDPARSNFDWVLKSWFAGVPGPSGLSLIKPPWGRVTAIDMNTGEHRWMTPNGMGPVNHPKLKALGLGPLGNGPGGPLVTKSLLIVGQSRGRGPENSPRLNVFDKTSGTLIGHIPLPDNPYGNPITYEDDGVQYIAVAVGGGPFFTFGGEEDFEGEDPDTIATIKVISAQRGTTPELVAFRLPK